MNNLAAAETGYGQSKMLSELLMAKAAEVCGTQVTVYRLPHIAGPIVMDGIWNRSEWIPTVSALEFTLSDESLTLYLHLVDSELEDNGCDPSESSIL